MEEQRDANLSVLMDDHAMRLEFADLVRADCNAERVVLTFVQRYPEAEDVAPTETNTSISGIQPMPSGRIVSRIVMSWPHLVRVRDMLSRLISERGSEVAATAQAVFGGVKTIEESND